MTYLMLKNGPYKDKVDTIVQGAISDSRGELVPNVFNKGESLKGNSYVIKLFDQFSKVGKLRDRLWVTVNFASELFVVSPKTVKLFKALNIDNVEYLDLRIVGNGLDISNYKLVNFIGKVNCVDGENSEIAYYTDTNPTHIYSIEWLAIDTEKIPVSLSIFLLDNTDILIVIVKEDLIRRIREEDLSGFVFVEPENYSVG